MKPRGVVCVAFRAGAEHANRAKKNLFLYNKMTEDRYRVVLL